MSRYLRRSILPIVAMAGILAVGMATPARADLEIQINGVTEASGLSGTFASFTGVRGGYTITALSTSSNSPGSPTFAILVGTDLLITNTSGTSAHLLITLGDTGFLNPTTPPNILMLSHVGGTVPLADPSNTLTFQSYVNTSNAQNATSGITTGPQTPSITFGSFSSDASTTITSLGAPYSMTQSFDLFLSAGSSINFSSSTTLASTVVPEPSNMALAGLGALGLIGYGLRRRKAPGA